MRVMKASFLLSLYTRHADDFALSANSTKSHYKLFGDGTGRTAGSGDSR